MWLDVHDRCARVFFCSVLRMTRHSKNASLKIKSVQLLKNTYRDLASPHHSSVRVSRFSKQKCVFCEQTLIHTNVGKQRTSIQSDNNSDPMEGKAIEKVRAYFAQMKHTQLKRVPCCSLRALFGN